MRAMVESSVFGEETGAPGGDVGVSNVGEDFGREAWSVADDARAEFVGGAFEA